MNRAERRRQGKGGGSGTSSRPVSDLTRLLAEALGHHRAGNFARAELLYQQIVQADPNYAEALHLYGVMLYQSGRLEQASEWLSRAIRRDSTKAPYFYNLGVVLQRQGKAAEAVTAYERAVTLHPGYVEAQCNLGNALRDLGLPDKALAAYRRALAIKPEYVDAQNNLGVALEELGRCEEAVASYELALRFNPQHAEAHNNLGSALKELGRLDEAIESINRAIALKADYAKAHYNLAFAYLWKGRLDPAHAAFMRSAQLKQGHGRPLAGQSLYKSRVRHEAEQARYLLDRGMIAQEQRHYVQTLERLDREAAGPAETHRIPVAAERMREIAPSFNRILHHVEAREVPQGTLNPALDVASIESQYHAGYPEIMYVDHLLNDEALEGMRCFCLESTVWKKDYENGYLGAFLGDGFSSPLLLQIAENLRLRFPGIFKDHRLRQAWAFKYDSRLRGLNIHADAAAVNVNFWITPDEANLDPAHGGLVVWNKEAPKEWNFREYNSTAMEPKIREFLRQSGAQAVTVPYRCNRAVIFNSDLFHETDHITFKDGYQHRRVNITLLYGRRSD
jgi:tetratricopeptide (TPR) repeat protein